MGDFLCFAGTNFAIGKDWFFLLGINFCDFQEVAFNWNFNIFFFCLFESDAIEIQVKQHTDVEHVKSKSMEYLQAFLFCKAFSNFILVVHQLQFEFISFLIVLFLILFCC